jgi:hypothetical protein
MGITAGIVEESSRLERKTFLMISHLNENKRTGHSTTSIIDLYYCDHVFKGKMIQSGVYTYNDLVQDYLLSNNKLLNDNSNVPSNLLFLP